MSLIPSHVEIDGTKYRVAQATERPYRKTVTRPTSERNSVVGSSRFAQPVQSDVLEWIWDDWSAGEGYKFLNPEGTHASQRGYFESGAIDVSKQGQVTVGKSFSNSFSTAAAAAGGPYLVAADGVPWVVYNTVARYFSGGSWNTIIVNPTDNVIAPIGSHSKYIFVSSAGEVRRLNTGGGGTWISGGHRGAMVTDSRVYVMNRSTESSTLKHAPLSPNASAPFATTTDGTLDGVGSSNSSAPLAMAAVGPQVFVLSGGSDQDPRLFVFNQPGNAAFHEVAVFEGLRVRTAEPGTQVLAVVNGVVFVGGWNRDDKVGEVRYFDGTNTGTIGEIRSDDTQTPSKVTCLAKGKNNELLIGQADGKIFRYALDTGGLSLLGTTVAAPSSGITSMLYHRGQYYVAYYDGTNIYIDVSSLTAQITGSTTITGPIWDFGLPHAEKLLTEIEVQTATASNHNVTISFGVDGAAPTTVSTDANGAAMTHSSGGRALFTVSGPSVERIFRYLTPGLSFAITSGTTAATLYSVTFRAIPMTTVTEYEVVVDLSDAEPGQRIVGNQRSGALQLRALDSLISSTSNRVFTFTPLFEDSSAPLPHPTATQVNVVLEESEYLGQRPGQGLYRLKLRKV